MTAAALGSGGTCGASFAWTETTAFWWPFLGTDVEALEWPDRPLPVLVVQEVVGLAVLVWCWVRFGLTDPGKELIGVVERILIDTANIKQLGEQFSNREQGQLVIATTHTQARYVLPHVVAAFRAAFPKVRLTLHQGSPTEIAAMLSDGDADIGICTETLRDVASLTTFPFYSWHHGVVVPRGHALATVEPLTLDAIAEVYARAVRGQEDRYKDWCELAS